MARSVGYGKLSIKALDPSNDEFTENLAYVRSNLAADSETANSEAASIGSAVRAMIENLTENTFKSASVSYEVDITPEA